MLSSHTGTGWLKELITRDDVQWNRVADAYQRWDYKEQHLNQVASAVLAVAVTAATSGSGWQRGRGVPHLPQPQERLPLLFPEPRIPE